MSLCETDDILLGEEVGGVDSLLTEGVSISARSNLGNKNVLSSIPYSLNSLSTLGGN